MANSLDNIMHKILARGLLALREQAYMPRLVNGDYSREAAMKGATIDVPVPSGKTATDVVPGPTYASAANSTPNVVQIQLNNWKKSNFYLSDKDQLEIDRNEHFIPMEMSEALRALANAVNADIFEEYKGVYGFTGTGGTTPFASTVNAATNARKVLHSQLAPRDNRRGVLDFDAEANALALAPFADAEKVGSNGVKIEGEIGRKYGIDWYADDAVPTHTAGAGASAVTIGSAVAAGASSIDLTGGNNVTLNKGDIFTIAGDTQTYVLNASVAVVSTGNVAASISPNLKADASSEVVTLKGDHVVNLAFHRDAFAFANRPLAQSTQDMQLGSKIAMMTDPQTGISLRLEVSRQYKQVTWELDILWGAKLVRAELATRIAG